MEEHGGILNRAMSLKHHLIDRPVHIHNLDLLWWEMVDPTDKRVCHGLQVIMMCLRQAIKNDHPRQYASCFNTISE
jgi:hypothetical protein